MGKCNKRGGKRDVQVVYDQFAKHGADVPTL